MNGFNDIVSKMMEVSPCEGDYTGEDGLLYCGKCHTPKETYCRSVEQKCGYPLKCSTDAGCPFLYEKCPFECVTSTENAQNEHERIRTIF